MKEEFQLNKHIWFCYDNTCSYYFLDLYTFNEYLMNQMRLSSIICLYVVSLMMIVLIYILCLEMTQYYQRLMNRKFMNKHYGMKKHLWKLLIKSKNITKLFMIIKSLLKI